MVPDALARLTLSTQYGAGSGNRTRMASLGSWCTTTVLYPRRGQGPRRGPLHRRGNFLSPPIGRINRDPRKAPWSPLPKWEQPISNCHAGAEREHGVFSFRAYRFPERKLPDTSGCECAMEGSRKPIIPKCERMSAPFTAPSRASRLAPRPRDPAPRRRRARRRRTAPPRRGLR